MEHYQEAPSQILRAIRACVTQEGEWTTDLPWMSQPALTASDRGISNRLTGRKVAKTLRLWVGHKKMGVISLYFALGVIRTFLGHAPSPGKRRGLNPLDRVEKVQSCQECGRTGAPAKMAESANPKTCEGGEPQ